MQKKKNKKKPQPLLGHFRPFLPKIGSMRIFWENRAPSVFSCNKILNSCTKNRKKKLMTQFLQKVWIDRQRWFYSTFVLRSGPKRAYDATWCFKGLRFISTLLTSQFFIRQFFSHYNSFTIVRVKYVQCITNHFSNYHFHNNSK